MVSERRNELIAELFHRVHFIEKWGRGISLILSKEPDTEFKEVGSHFIVVFRRKMIEKGVEIIQNAKGKIREKTIPKTTLKKVLEKVLEKVPEKVTDNQQKILYLILASKHTTISELANIVGISERKIRENIKKLKNKGLLRRIGPDKGGHWEVVK